MTLAETQRLQAWHAIHGVLDGGDTVAGLAVAVPRYDNSPLRRNIPSMNEALKPSNEAISESFALGLQRLTAGPTPRRRQETKTLVDVEDSCCDTCRTVLCRAELRGDYAHFSEGCRER